MSQEPPQRVAANSLGDFYVEAGRCTRCCLPHEEAPGLLNDPGEPFDECYFRRQPRTPREIEQAIDAICVSEMEALRYGGRDEAIIARLRARDRAAQCDHAPEAITARAKLPTPPQQVLPQGRRRWWRRLLG